MNFELICVALLVLNLFFTFWLYVALNRFFSGEQKNDSSLTADDIHLITPVLNEYMSTLDKKKVLVLLWLLTIGL